MASFRCPYYYWDANWYCAKLKSALSLHDYDTFCTDETRYRQCPYFNR